MSALLGAEDISGAANLQVAHGNRKTGAHLTVFFNCPQAFGRSGGEVFFLVDEQIAICPVFVTTHASTKLVKVGQSVAIGLIDKNGVRVWNIETTLDDGRCEQNIKAVRDKVDHDLLKLVFGHLTMPDLKARLGDDLLQTHSDAIDILHTIMYKEDLSAPVQFAEDCVADHLGIESRDAGFHRHPILRRRFQIADVPGTEQGKMQRTWDRCGG